VSATCCALFEGELSTMEVEEREQLRANNPEFAKLLDVISETYLEDGTPKRTLTKLKEVRI